MNRIIFTAPIKAKLVNRCMTVNILVLQDILVNENTLGNVYVIKALTTEIDLNKAKTMLMSSMIFNFKSKEINIESVVVQSVKTHSENYIALELISIITNKG